MSDLTKAVEGLHGCKATLNHTEHVHEIFQGKTVWEGDVHVFDIAEHKTASICYAWSEPVQGSDRRRFYAVLHVGPVRSAHDAVRASIIAQAKREG